MTTIKILTLTLLSFIFYACATPNVKEADKRTVVLPLPTLCKEHYHIRYGILRKNKDGYYLEEDGRLNSIPDQNKQFIDKNVFVVSTSITQSIAGLPHPDGRDSSYTRSIPRVVHMDTLEVNSHKSKEKIEKFCNELK